MSDDAPWEEYAAPTAKGNDAAPWEDYGGESTDTAPPSEAERLVAGHDSSVDNYLHQVGSGLYHGVVGGYKGIGKLISGQGLDAAADAVNDETAKTYQAPDSTVKTVMDSKYNPLNYAQDAADWAADKSADAGWSPAVSTALKAAPAALAALTGTAGLLRGAAPAALRGIKNVTGYAEPAKLDTAAATVTRTPEEVLAQAAQRQSMGAAASSLNLDGVSPELRQSVAATDPDKLHLDALHRQIRAETLPLPEGMTPLRFRKGQATRDAMQISDEKNLRGDKDTGGLLADSISDQSKKLGASIGEIQQRAVPHIVQRSDLQHDQAAIDAIKSQDNEALTDIRQKYKTLADANGGDMPIDTAEVVDQITPILKKQTLRNTVANHPALSEIMDALKSGESIDFETFENMRTRLAEVQRGKDGAAATAAGIIHDQLNSMPLTEQAAPLRNMADVARRAARDRFAMIEDNPAYKAAVNDNVRRDPNTNLHVIGAPSPLAGSFLSRYATGEGSMANPALVSRLKKAVPNPELHDAIEAATLNKLRDAAGINPLGEGVFKPFPYNKAVGNIEDKLDLLMKPETVKNVQHLREVANDIAWEDPATMTNRSNTAATLARFGAIPVQAPPSLPSVGTHIMHAGTSMVAGNVPGGHILHSVGDTLLSRRAAMKSAKAQAEMEAAERNAKLKFAQDAVKPGAGIERETDTATPPPIARAAGGAVTEDALVARLMHRYRQAKRMTEETTKPLLNVPDEAIVHALKVANRSI